MAAFYGEVQGNRKAASRQGTYVSGITAKLGTRHKGGISVRLYYGTGGNRAEIKLIPWQGHGEERILYDGPIDALTALGVAVTPSTPVPAMESTVPEAPATPALAGLSESARELLESIGKVE